MHKSGLSLNKMLILNPYVVPFGAKSMRRQNLVNVLVVEMYLFIYSSLYISLSFSLSLYIYMHFFKNR